MVLWWFYDAFKWLSSVCRTSFACFARHSSGRGRRVRAWERALCHVLRAEALLDMDAPRRALTELHPAKELLETSRAWPQEVLQRVAEADGRIRQRKERKEEERKEKEEKKVPVTVITGFLGSGKTCFG